MKHHAKLLCVAILLASCAKKETPRIEQESSESYHVSINAVDEAFYFYDVDGTALTIPEPTMEEKYEDHVKLGGFQGSNTGFSLEILAKENAGPQDSIFAIYSFFTKVEELETDVEYVVSTEIGATNQIFGRMLFWTDTETYESLSNPFPPTITFSEITDTHAKGTFRGVLQAYDYESWEWKDQFITITNGEFFVPLQ